jgi:SAM-dependent methyltransferase
MNKDDWNKRYAGADLLWSKGPNQFVADELGDLEPGTAIELAAGEGRNAIWLAENGWEVTAVDFSDVALDRGRAIAVQRGVEVNWVQADLDTYELPPQSFDLVVVAYLQLPWDRLAPILERAAAAVRPGGTFFLIGHDRRNLAEGYGGPKSETVLYGPDDVTSAIGDLSVIRAETVVRAVQTEHGVRDALDVLVRATR